MEEDDHYPKYNDEIAEIERISDIGTASVFDELRALDFSASSTGSTSPLPDYPNPEPKSPWHDYTAYDIRESIKPKGAERIIGT